MQNWKQYHSKLQETISKLDNLLEASAYQRSDQNPEMDKAINEFLTFDEAGTVTNVNTDGLAKLFVSKTGNDYKYILDQLVVLYKNSNNPTVKQELYKVIEGGLTTGYYTQTLSYKILSFLGADLKNKDNFDLVRDVASLVLSGKRTSKIGKLKGFNKLQSSLDNYELKPGRGFYDYISNIKFSPIADMIKDDVAKLLFSTNSISNPEGKELSNDGDGSFEGIDVAQSDNATFEMDDYQANQLMKLGLDQDILHDFIQAYRHKETPEELESDYNKIGEDGETMKGYYLKFIKIMNAKSESSQDSQKLRNQLSKRLRDKGEVGIANFFDAEVALKEKGIPNTQLIKTLLSTVGNFKKFDLLPYLKRGVYNVVVSKYFQEHPELDFDDLSKSLSFSSDNRTKYVTGILDQREYEAIINKLHSLGANDIISMLGFLTSKDETYDNKTVEEILGQYSTGNVENIRRVAFQRAKDVYERFLLDMTRGIENFSIKDIWNGLKSYGVKKSLEEDYEEELDEKAFKQWVEKHDMI